MTAPWTVLPGEGRIAARVVAGDETIAIVPLTVRRMDTPGLAMKEARVLAGAPALRAALMALLQEAVWDEDSDRAAFDAAYAQGVAAVAMTGDPE